METVGVQETFKCSTCRCESKRPMGSDRVECKFCEKLGGRSLVKLIRESAQRLEEET